ncbi:MAG: formate/nitrite transporter family protein [Methanobrevibacter sp.]|nr:formate/nitrite transporter family protein [Methanobrevibacter sp.]
MLSIVAGMMIAIGGIIYLTLSGLEGALLFSMGLLTILCLKLELFTGKAGLLATKEITPGKLLEIWIGNFIGTLGMALMLLLTPRGIELSNKAMEIVAVRLANGFFVNLIYGIFCGMLMFMAVKTWQFTNGNPFYAMMPVGIFIVCGFNHCVADMFYLHMGCLHFSDYWVLIPTTIGNLIGCNIIPWAINQSS